MIKQPDSSSKRLFRLDNSLFWLRWLFVIGAAVLALQAEGTLLDLSAADMQRLVLCVGVTAVGNGLFGVFVWASSNGRWSLVVGALVDAVSAGLFFWAYDGALPPFLLMGLLAVVVASFRLGWLGWLVSMVVVVISSGVGLARLSDTPNEVVAGWILGAAILLVLGGLGIALRRWRESGSADTRIVEVMRLRVARERARALSEMANTLGATLDHRQVLESAQMIGMVAIHDDLGTDMHFISAVLLFQGTDNRLRVIAHRGLTRADESVALAGREGVLGLALKQAEPVFAGDAVRDPELQYIAAFQPAKAVLAIPLRAGFDNYGVMVFGCDRPNAFSDAHRELMEAIGKQATLALQNAVLYQNLLLEKEKIVDVEESARKKLARDLHDGPTQSVAAIAMRANYIRRLIERQPQQALQELWKMEDLARRTTKEIRHMLFTLRPLVLETKGLVAALEQLAEKMGDTHDTAVAVVAQDDVESSLDLNTQGVLFYIIEEAVNNARKHAQSSQIWVRLYWREKSYIIAEVEDNGMGFDVKATTTNYDQRGSLGLVNMRERADLIEGTLRIQSAQGRGTKISILLPVQMVGLVDTTTGTSTISAPIALQSQRPETGSVAERMRSGSGVARQTASPDAAPDPRSAPPDRPKRPSTTRPIQPITSQDALRSRTGQPVSSSQQDVAPGRPVSDERNLHSNAAEPPTGTARPVRVPHPASNPPTTPQFSPVHDDLSSEAPQTGQQSLETNGAPDPRDSRPRKPGSAKREAPPPSSSEHPDS